MKANEAMHLEHIAQFQIKMARETEDLELDKEVVLKGVAAVFQDPTKGQYYVACYDKRIVASTLITFEWSDWRAKTIWWIQSVYVLPELRGRKVFREMYHYLKTRVLESSDVGGLRLYVDKSNKLAQKVYTAIGMNGEHYHLFEWLK